MPKGAKPGQRFGGKAKGSKHKATIQRELIAAEIAARTVADAKINNKPLAKEVLDQFMHVFAGMAATFQPLPPGAQPKPGHTPNEDKFEKWAVLAVKTARDLAQFQSPTFKAIAITPPPETNPGDRRKRFTLTIFEGERPRMLDPPKANGHDDVDVIDDEDRRH